MEYAGKGRGHEFPHLRLGPRVIEQLARRTLQDRQNSPGHGVSPQRPVDLPLGLAPAHEPLQQPQQSAVVDRDDPGDLRVVGGQLGERSSLQLQVTPSFVEGRTLATNSTSQACRVGRPGS